MFFPSFKKILQISCDNLRMKNKTVGTWQGCKTHEFKRIRLFLQKIISLLALLFSCNRKSLPHVNSAGIILCKFLAFNCAIFPNTNLVVAQSLDRFDAVVHSNIFMVNWMDSIIEGIQSIGMVKRSDLFLFPAR